MNNFIFRHFSKIFETHIFRNSKFSQFPQTQQTFEKKRLDSKMEIPQSDLLLHSAIKSHDDYFSNIISMIPRDLYQPEEEGKRKKPYKTLNIYILLYLFLFLFLF